MFFFRIKKFLKYWLFSKHKRGFGTHSPFLYKLITGVFSNKKIPEVVYTIENKRREYLQDKRAIEVRDLGAGSSLHKGTKRTISEMTKSSSVPKKYGILLMNMASEFGKRSVIELGTSLGISTMYLSSGAPMATIYTIEGSEEVANEAKKRFTELGFCNIHQYVGDFGDLLDDVLSDAGTPSMVFVDGNHRKKPTIDYFNRIVEKSSTDTVIVFDDIYYSEEMFDAWNEIKDDSRVTLSVDIYRMGLLFFKNGLYKSNYVIRY